MTLDINDILANLGLDLSNPEVKRGAIEAIDAILSSRIPPTSMGGGGMSGDIDVDIDPDLLQPSKKRQPEVPSDDIEIDDEEDILSKIKHNDSESNPSSSSSSTGTEAGSSSGSTSSENGSNELGSTGSSERSDTETGSEQDDAEELTDETTNEVSKQNTDNEDAGGEGTIDDENKEELSKDGDSAEDNFTDDEANATDSDSIENSDETAELDDNDLLDDTLKDTYDDLGIKAKYEARRIKRERTLLAAKKALEDAKAKKVSRSLIHELERAIAGLEELTEAVKSLKDISDEEFNRRINSVLEAIYAVGDESLTFTSDKERELRAQEIKTDLASSRTQAELSAEDVAQIRAETQAVKARNAEADKYKARARSSFKGFQDFLNSLYRAIALQVHVEETRDDTWSAINRRHSGSGVLQPGQRVQELNNKKIPVIDFYFDCSASWGPADIAVGKEAVKKLAEMEEEGKIKINLYYFANHVHSDFESAEAEGGTRAWNDIVKNVISTQATNVIIMTDSDMENWWEDMSKPALRYTVPGYVWYLWRDGENAPRLPRDLKGRGGVQQFSFSRGDV